MGERDTATHIGLLWPYSALTNTPSPPKAAAATLAALQTAICGDTSPPDHTHIEAIALGNHVDIPQTSDSPLPVHFLGTPEQHNPTTLDALIAAGGRLSRATQLRESEIIGAPAIYHIAAQDFWQWNDVISNASMALGDNDYLAFESQHAAQACSQLRDRANQDFVARTGSQHNLLRFQVAWGAPLIDHKRIAQAHAQRDAIRSAKGIAVDDSVITLAVGQDSIQSVGPAIRAIARARTDADNDSLIAVICATPNAAALTNIAGQFANTTVWDYGDDDTRLGHIAASDVFVYVNTYSPVEPSRAVVEAQALGLPSIVADIAGGSEWINDGDSGFGVDILGISAQHDLEHHLARALRTAEHEIPLHAAVDFTSLHARTATLLADPAMRKRFADAARALRPYQKHRNRHRDNILRMVEASRTSKATARFPQLPRYFDYARWHASHRIVDEDTLAPAKFASGPPRLPNLTYIGWGFQLPLVEALYRGIVESRYTTVGAAIADTPLVPRQKTVRHLLLLAKHGYIQLHATTTMTGTSHG